MGVRPVMLLVAAASAIAIGCGPTVLLDGAIEAARPPSSGHFHAEITRVADAGGTYTMEGSYELGRGRMQFVLSNLDGVVCPTDRVELCIPQRGEQVSIGSTLFVRTDSDPLGATPRWEPWQLIEDDENEVLVVVRDLAANLPAALEAHRNELTLGEESCGAKTCALLTLAPWRHGTAPRGPFVRGALHLAHFLHEHGRPIDLLVDPVLGHLVMIRTSVPDPMPDEWRHIPAGVEITITFEAADVTIERPL